jgi:hypothetical protein
VTLLALQQVEQLLQAPVRSAFADVINTSCDWNGPIEFEIDRSS